MAFAALIAETMIKAAFAVPRRSLSRRTAAKLWQRDRWGHGGRCPQRGSGGPLCWSRTAEAVDRTAGSRHGGAPPEVLSGNFPSQYGSANRVWVWVVAGIRGSDVGRGFGAVAGANPARLARVVHGMLCR